jgi:hypothetical protein
VSWGAQNRSKDAKTPSAGPAMSEKPKLALCGIQPYVPYANSVSALIAYRLSALQMTSST